VQSRFDDLSEVQINPRHFRGALVGAREPRPGSAKVRSGPLDVLARVESIRLEVGTVAGVRPVRVSAEVNTIRESRGALDDQVRSVLRSHRELLPPRGGLSFFERLHPRQVRVGVAFSLESDVRRSGNDPPRVR
jgi:hypothetical protein